MIWKFYEILEKAPHIKNFEGSEEKNIKALIEKIDEQFVKGKDRDKIHKNIDKFIAQIK